MMHPLINESWIKIKTYWMQLALREKCIIFVGSLILGLLIIYEGVWAPMSSHLATMRTTINAQRNTLREMKIIDQQIHQLQTISVEKRKSLSIVELLSELQTQVNQAGLAENLTQLKQTASDTIDIQFQKVDFDLLMALLRSICKTLPISITQLSAVRLTTPGFASVELNLTLQQMR